MSTHNPFNIFHTLRCKWCALRALTYVHSSTLTDLQNPARRYTLDIHVITCYLIYCIQSPIMLPSRPLVQSIDDDDDLTAEMLRCNLRYCVAAVQHSVNQSVYCYHKTTAAKYFWCGVLIYFALWAHNSDKLAALVACRWLILRWRWSWQRVCASYWCVCMLFHWKSVKRTSGEWKRATFETLLAY